MNIKKEELRFIPFNKDMLSTFLMPVIMLGVEDSRPRQTQSFPAFMKLRFSGEGKHLNNTKAKVPGTMDHQKRST